MATTLLRPAAVQPSLNTIELSVRAEEPTALRRAARWAVRQPGLLVAVLLLLLVSAWVIVPQLFTTVDPLTGTVADRLLPPSAQHIFGTDALGRDMYARVVNGAVHSVQAILIAVGVALVVGSLLGLAAGFFGRWVDDVLMRVVDVVLAIPSLLLSMALITILGYGLVNVAIAVGLASVANFARLMRADVLKVRTSLYVEAARAAGCRWWTILFRHVLPNSAGSVVAVAALEFGTAVLAVSALSFLGFGAPAPTPEWGRLVSEGRDFIATAWWMVTFPGLIITLLVLAANRVARALEKGGRQ
ncbi:putative D,D-dipeptide transport system permease protein DdpC [Microbacterium lemovicicum]|uniref:Putative D,D-dipeptide transport system permease protein DdpC n=1 Tax=Microbacterium lemovicicum TaxID=1072463 RepID=A0A3S9W6R7_9MICO|nr:ABC transporter permease [Microbacterium lemovicicum]AZS35787.1 putative D,D-dipeptide transport system permease protein DdpC [Microbacterium lemovicicum]